MIHIEKQHMQSHKRRAVMQSRYISSKSIHKPIKKYDNEDEFITRIVCSMIIMIIYKQENRN